MSASKASPNTNQCTPNMMKIGEKQHSFQIVLIENKIVEFITHLYVKVRSRERGLSPTGSLSMWPLWAGPS